MRLDTHLVLCLCFNLTVVQSFVVSPQRPLTQSTRSRLCSATDDREQDESSLLIVEPEADAGRRNLLINTIAGGLLAASGVASWELYKTEVYTPTGFTRLPVTQFLAALGDPAASEGTGAKQWGLWREDPGPRGVWLRDYESQLKQKDNVAPRGWKFDPNDFWVEEHGLIMESPKFPIQPGRYLVTGARQVTTGLTIKDDGSWKLDEGTLYDVTHLPCRSARYNPVTESGGPLAARLSDFPVRPGAEMPSIPGTKKQDYAVLFVIGKAI